MIRAGGRPAKPIEEPPSARWAANAKPRPWRRPPPGAAPEPRPAFDVHAPMGAKHYIFTDHNGDRWQCNYPRHENAPKQAVADYSKVLSVCEIERVLREQGNGAFRPDRHTRLSNAIWIVQVRKVMRRYRSVIDKADADLRREWKRRAGLSDTRVSRLQENMIALAKHRRRWRQMTKGMNTFAGDAVKVDIGKLNDAYA